MSWGLIMPVLFKTLLALALFYVLVMALMFALQNRLLFMPDRRVYSQDHVGVKGFDDIDVVTADGLPLRGWYAKARNGKPTVVMFHGNASTWAFRAPDFAALAAEGYGVLLAGYRGYGGNPGSPSEDGFYMDAEAYLKASGVPLENIVLYGESLGTGVAVEMAVRHPAIKAMVLEAPYATIAEVASFHFPFIAFMKMLLTERFESITKIEKAPMPKLFLLAGRDRVVPEKFGKKLFDAAAEPKTLKRYPWATHMDIRARGGMDDVTAFLAALK